MIQKLTSLVLSAVVCVIVVVVMAIPILDSTQHTLTEMEQNTGARYMSALDDEMSLEISSYNAETHTFTVNGESLTTYVTDDPTNIPTDRIYILWDNGFAYSSYDDVNEYWNLPVVYFVDSDNTLHAPNMTYNTLTLSNGVATLAGGSTYTGTYSYIVMPSLDGKLGAYAITDLPKYVDSNSTIYTMCGYYSSHMLMSKGTLDDQVVTHAFENNVLVENVKVTASYEPTKYGVSNTLNDIEVTNFNTAQGSYEIFIPLEYTVVTEKSGTIYTIIGIIPIMIIIGLIMLVVGTAFYYRQQN